MVVIYAFPHFSISLVANEINARYKDELAVGICKSFQ